MSTGDYKWHFDYIRLAWDAGFSFDKCKYPNLDKNKICLVDIDRIIKERDVASVERFVPTVIQYILENDQAELLDTNFVKMFRMSQLSVEYLLFCKKYLDNTVVLLKKEISKLKEENKELKLYTEELENHISTLTKQSFRATFKCEKCPKAFSSEEYLNSHNKRRHSTENKVIVNTETDQLESEIKQLKERLNVAEKLLHEKEEKTENTNEDKSKIKVDEILNKFEKFKDKVENDLKMLQLEKNFYEEKYSKLFDVMLESNKKENIASEVSAHLEPVQKIVDLQTNKYSVGDTLEKIETTTQTEKLQSSRKLEIEMVNDKNVFEFKEVDRDSENKLKSSDIQETIEQKINQFEEQIELKISSGLNNIEKQMQAFWGKLSEIALNRNADNIKEITNLSPQEEPIQVETLKPKIKPRMKLSKPSKLTDDNKENAEKIRLELEKMYKKRENPPILVETMQKTSPVKISSIMYDSSSEEEKSETENKSESDSESSAVKMSPKKKREVKPVISTSSLKKTPPEVTKKKIREEINNAVNNKLQEIGISPDWKGIPQKTFERAREIVQHQARLARKSCPNFDAIKKSIEATLKRRTNKSTARIKSRKKSTPQKTVANVINIRYRRKSNDPEPEPKPSSVPLTIKNRSLYNTDSDSDDLRAVKPLSKVSEVVPAYSAVVEELKMTRNRNADTDSDVNSVILPKEGEIHTKSALRNYPSVGSLAKKKVLFDIDSDIEIDRAISVDSSDVIDEVDTKKQEKNEGSLSDFDLSDL